MPNSTPVTSAHVALREATAALLHGRNASRDGGPLSEPGHQVLGADAAAALDALAGLLRSVGLEPVPTSAASHDYHALLQQVVYSAALARRVAGPDQHSDAPNLMRAGGPMHGAPDD